MFTEKLLQNLGRAMRDDPLSRLAIRHASFASLLEIGDETLLIKSHEGEVRFVPSPTTDDPWDFAVRGPAEAWDRLRAAPTPTSNHPLGMATQGHMSLSGNTPNYLRLEGNYQKLFANMAPLCAILDQLRRVEG